LLLSCFVVGKESEKSSFVLAASWVALVVLSTRDLLE